MDTSDDPNDPPVTVSTLDAMWCFAYTKYIGTAKKSSLDAAKSRVCLRQVSFFTIGTNTRRLAILDGLSMFEEKPNK